MAQAGEAGLVLSIVFTFYKTLDLDHLERAMYSLSRQTALCRASELVFVDNNTEYSEAEIKAVVESHFQEPFVKYHFCKHGNDDRRHSWSANYGIRAATNDLFFFTRADYILMEDALEQMVDEWAKRKPALVSGWRFHMGAAPAGCVPGTPIDEPAYESYGWREDARFLLQGRRASFYNSHQDAGVFVTTRTAIALGGWYDEAMIGFGYQQSTLQRHMWREDIAMIVVPEFLYLHQFHEAERDFTKAHEEYNNSKGG